MIELPEASVLAGQINKVLAGKKIRDVTAAYTPHKFAWYSGDPGKYGQMLTGERIGSATNHGGMVRIDTGKAALLFSDGVNLRYLDESAKRPQKHQLLIEFDDGTAMSASVRMYGALWCAGGGDFTNGYYRQALIKPSPLSDDFSRKYFYDIVSGQDTSKMSVKELLATGQRIPGLGNGVLQDILFVSRINPRKKAVLLTEKDIEKLYSSIRSTLLKMTAEGGRDTEADLFGDPGGYATLLCRNTLDRPCISCGGKIVKEAYLGGSVYYCPECQKI